MLPLCQETKSLRFAFNKKCSFELDDREKIKNIKYDETYLESNLKFFDAVNIPHFNERTPDGVFNVEYDCDLEGIKDLSENDLITWIKENSIYYF